MTFIALCRQIEAKVWDIDSSCINCKIWLKPFLKNLIISLIVLLINTYLFADQVQFDKHKLLKYSNKGYVLGFGISQVVIAAKHHMLSINLVDANYVKPIPINRSKNKMKQERFDHVEITPLLSTVIKYCQPWPGVNVYYQSDGQGILKSEYRLAAGMIKQGLEKIQLDYNRTVSVDHAGQLIIDYEYGKLIENRPIAWQEIDGKKTPILISYVKHENNRIGFQASGYDEHYPLIIDPSLEWNSFSGGIGFDENFDITIDDNGNVYVAGQSDAAWGVAPLRPYSNGRDGYISKFDQNGNFIWHTFLGGNTNDNCHYPRLDASGNVLYVVGYSDATWGSPISSYNAGNDAYVAKLDNNGNLLWNTFLGGASNDSANRLVVNNDNSYLYILGASNDNWGSPIRSHSSSVAPPNGDGFVVKMDSSGNLVWTTFIGGPATDKAFGIALDTNENVYATGHSEDTWESPIRPYTAGRDIYVVKLDNNGSLEWNTFLGGTGTDECYENTVSNDDFVYIVGNSTESWGTPIQGFSSGSDACVAKLNSSGILQWHTFIGESGNQWGTGIGLSVSGDILITGHSVNSWGAPWRAYTANVDGFASMLNEGGNVVWHGFLGGTGNDYIFNMALNPIGQIYVAGRSDNSWHSPIEVYNLDNDGFVAKIGFNPSTPVSTPTSVFTMALTRTPSTTIQLGLKNLIIYPNPFKATDQSVTIQYPLYEDADVSITIYSYLGTKIKRFEYHAGELGGQGSPTGLINKVTWDGRNDRGLLQQTGGYICQIKARAKQSGQQEEVTSKIALIR